MEQQNKFIAPGEKLKFEDMDLLYENIPKDNFKHSWMIILFP